MELFRNCGRIKCVWMNVCLNSTNWWEGQPSHSISFTCSAARESPCCHSIIEHYILLPPHCLWISFYTGPNPFFPPKKHHMVYGQLLGETVKLTSNRPLWQVLPCLQYEPWQTLKIMWRVLQMSCEAKRINPLEGAKEGLIFIFRCISNLWTYY